MAQLIFWPNSALIYFDIKSQLSAAQTLKKIKSTFYHQIVGPGGLLA